MKCARLLLVALLAAASVAAADDLSPSRAFGAGLMPPAANMPACPEIRAAGPATDNPPPFGTIVQAWELRLSGAYAGAGLTWRQDSNRFYLMDQGTLGGVWSCDASDPLGTLRREARWVLPDLGTEIKDTPWGIAWDSDSNCFWISNIVDGDIYGGCHYIRMRRTATGDTWRWFSEKPGDTWLVGDGSCAGAGRMYWMGGSKKHPNRDYFICMPIGHSPSTNNYVWKFNPYTKTSLGRCAHGNMTSERGCGLVPWDSNYILTTGWNANRLYKRDSTGFALDSVPVLEAPVDVVLWVPQTIGVDDTAFIYTIVNDTRGSFQKRSTGLLWRQLPSRHPSNLLPRAVLAPVGTVDSGLALVPRLAVHNTGRVPASGVNVYFTIEGDGHRFYSDSLTNLRLGACTGETLAFTDWTPRGRDSMSVVAWTSWAGDSFPQDDTIRNRFLVRVKDIALTEIVAPAPDTVLDSGVVFAPQCWAWNYGNVPLSFDVRFRICDYEAACHVSIIPGGAKLVTAPTPYTALPGIWTCRVCADVVGDQHPEDNLRVDTFTVRGATTKDVEARAVLYPTGVVDTGTTVLPQARFANLGIEAALFWTYFGIYDSSGAEVYAESLQTVVAPGDSTDMQYPGVSFAVPGLYTALCSVAMAGDQNFLNDAKLDTFEVGSVGMADRSFTGGRGLLSSTSFTVSPSPCRDFAFLSFTGPPDDLTTRPPSLSLYDASGRLVHRTPFAVRPSPFALDLRRLPAGVYMLRLSAGTFAGSRRFVLQH